MAHPKHSDSEKKETMGLETVLESIQKNAQHAATAALNEAKHSEEQLRAQAKERIEALRTAEQQRVELEIATARARARVQHSLAIRSATLTAKRAILDQAYTTFLGRATGPERAKVFPKLAALAKPMQPAAVFVADQDLLLAKKAFPRAAVKSRPMAGGLIAESADGRQLMDLRLETIIDLLRAKTDRMVAEALFTDAAEPARQKRMLKPKPAKAPVKTARRKA